MYFNFILKIVFISFNQMWLAVKILLLNGTHIFRIHSNLFIAFSKRNKNYTSNPRMTTEHVFDNSHLYQSNV